MHRLVTHRATPRFWQLYRLLPEEVRQVADANFQLLKDDSRHPSVRLKKVGDYWSARVGLHYRALALEHNAELVWFWIGHHSDYDKLLNRN